MSLPRTNTHRVISRTDLTSDVFEIELERSEVNFTPGENLTIFNEAGNVSRPYSIASGANDSSLRFVIRRMPDGAVSNYLGSRSPGDVVQATPPFGWFRPGNLDSDAPFAFLATGTGIAPFLSWIRTHPEINPEWVLYGTRMAADAAAVDELHASTDLRLAVSREQVNDVHHGRITDLLPNMPVTPRMRFFLCGLDAMIDDAIDALESRGVPFEHIHREVFFHAET